MLNLQCSWLQDAEGAASDGNKHQRRSLSEIQERIFELNGGAETASYLIMQVRSPVTMRTLNATTSHCKWTLPRSVCVYG